MTAPRATGAVAGVLLALLATPARSGEPAPDRARDGHGVSAARKPPRATGVPTWPDLKEVEDENPLHWYYEDWNTYTDTEDGFRLRYPHGMKTRRKPGAETTGPGAPKEDDWFFPGLPLEDGVDAQTPAESVRFSLPADYFGWTNFGGAVVEVRVRPQDARGECEPPGRSVARVRINGEPFEADGFGEGWTGHESIGRRYRARRGGRCFEIFAALFRNRWEESEHFYVIPEGVVFRFTEENEAAVRALLDGVVATFRFLPTEARQEPATTPSASPPDHDR